jgi:hypothetical protein
VSLDGSSLLRGRRIVDVAGQKLLWVLHVWLAAVGHGFGGLDEAGSV